MIRESEEPMLRIHPPFGTKTKPSQRMGHPAYGVTIAMAQAQGASVLSGTKPGRNISMTFWNGQKLSYENQNMRSNMIKTLYLSWAIKAFGENTNGSGWGTK